MSLIVIFDPATTPNKILETFPSASTPDYIGRTDFLENPSLSAVQSVPQKYWKHVAGTIVEMTAGEKNAVDVSIATALTAFIRSSGKNVLDATDPDGIILRALADIVRDELNIVRQWLASFKTEVAAATTLADLKTRVASLPATTDRTLSQLRSAIKSRIDTGSVDA